LLVHKSAEHTLGQVACCPGARVRSRAEGAVPPDRTGRTAGFSRDTDQGGQVKKGVAVCCVQSIFPGKSRNKAFRRKASVIFGQQILAGNARRQANRIGIDEDATNSEPEAANCPGHVVADPRQTLQGSWIAWDPTVVLLDEGIATVDERI